SERHIGGQLELGPEEMLAGEINGALQFLIEVLRLMGATSWPTEHWLGRRSPELFLQAESTY
ncbi:MAG: hypothetical protein AAGE01_14360, partial [Pseudomonadota bacterium]